MPSKKTNRRFHSRLVKIEQKKSLSRILFFGSATILFLILIFSGGLTALANFAFLLGQPETPAVTPSPAPIFLSPPILSPLPSAFNSTKIKLTGFSQKETRIEIFLNEKSQGTVKTDDQGQFEKEISLQEGENVIYTIAQDFLGNYSPQSEKIKIVFDKEPPELEIKAPLESEKFYQEKNQTIEIKGQTDSSASLYLNDHLLILGSEGNFSTQLKLSEGENILRFLARDPAGNETEKEIKTFYQL